MDSVIIIRSLVERYCPDIEVCCCASSVTEAVQSIKQNKPDLVFLDIELSGGSGFDVLDSLEGQSFEVIFISAYNHYAIKAIRFSALDYLMKPIDVDDFKTAIQRVREKFCCLCNYNPRISNLKHNNNNHSVDDKKIALPSENGFIFINLKDIIRCQADSNYTTFFFSGKKKAIIPRTLKDYESLLEEYNFCRIHGSHLVNMNHVIQYLKGKGGFVVMSDGTEIEVSVRKKEQFLKSFLRL
jgi:two-component system LytT family response regulator